MSSQVQVTPPVPVGIIGEGFITYGGGNKDKKFVAVNDGGFWGEGYMDSTDAIKADGVIILPTAIWDLTKMIEGRVLTIIDASVNDPVQREALKSLVKTAVREAPRGNLFTIPVKGI